MKEQKFRYKINLCIPSTPLEYFQVTLGSSLNTSLHLPVSSALHIYDVKFINRQDKLITDLLHHFA